MGKTAVTAVLEVGEQAEAAAEEVFKGKTAEAAAGLQIGKALSVVDVQAGAAVLLALVVRAEAAVVLGKNVVEVGVTFEDEF